jgi:hypothetical protein
MRCKVPINGWFLPDAYLVGIALYAIGATVETYGYGNTSGKDIVLMSFITLSSALIGCSGHIVLFRQYYINQRFLLSGQTIKCGNIEKTVVLWGLWLCIFVCIVFMLSVSINDNIMYFLNFAANFDDFKLLDARKAITTGMDGYLAPGFVKQFRDNLTPILLISLTILNARECNKYKTIYYITLLIVIPSMFISGIRSIIVILFISLFLARLLIAKGLGKYKLIYNIMLFFVIILFIYGGLTFYLGRVDEGILMLQVPISIIDNLFQRIFITVPSQNIATYNYWGIIGPTYGAYWSEELLSIMPGVRGFGLSNQLHALYGGSDHGNSPLGMPADIWFTWGWWGNLIVPLFYSMCLGCFDMLLTSKRSIVFTGIKIFMTISLLKIYSPFGFVLYGGLSSLILMMIILVIKKESRRSEKNTRPVNLCNK